MAMYNSFCVNIDTWVERQFTNADGVSVGLSQRVWGEKLQAILGQYFTKGMSEITEGYPNAQEAMSKWLMHRHLHASIIADVQYHDCLKPAQNKLLSIIAKAMRGFEPKEVYYVLS
jgi:hypothetical protein